MCCPFSERQSGTLFSITRRFQEFGDVFFDIFWGGTHWTLSLPLSLNFFGLGLHHAVALHQRTLIALSMAQFFVRIYLWFPMQSSLLRFFYSGAGIWLILNTSIWQFLQIYFESFFQNSAIFSNRSLVCTYNLHHNIHTIIEVHPTNVVFSSSVENWISTLHEI